MRGLENSRIQVMDTPVAAPGTCVICGVPGPCEDGRKFVDFGLLLEFYGVVYFCTECISPVALAAGYISSVEMETIKSLSEGFIKEAETLKEENRILKAALVSLFTNRGFAARANDGSILPVEELSELAQFGSEVVGAESKSSKSSSRKGSASVQSDSTGSIDGDSFLE